MDTKQISSNFSQIEMSGIGSQLKLFVMPYTKVHESFNVSELQLIKHALTHAKIEYVVWNEAILQTGAGFGGTHGARIMVITSQMDKAKSVLEKFDFIDIK